MNPGSWGLWRLKGWRLLSPLLSRQRCSVCNLLSRPFSPFRAEGQWGLPPQCAPRPKLWASTLPAVSVGMTYVVAWPLLLRYGGINHPVSGEVGADAVGPRNKDGAACVRGEAPSKP